MKVRKPASAFTPGVRVGWRGQRGGARPAGGGEIDQIDRFGQTRDEHQDASAGGERERHPRSGAAR